VRVYNGGTYDLLHAGHMFAFRQMRQLAGPDGEVIIGLNTDEFVARFKDHATVQPLAERLAIVSALRLVDVVLVNVGDEDSKVILEVVRPDVIAVGPDWWSEDDSRYCLQMGFTPEWLEARQIALHYMRLLPDHSSTRIRRQEPEGIATHSGVIGANWSARAATKPDL
jgi:glycerol-3-phosphate cytidylyltransferase